jgi:hypothetical protein
VSDTTERKAPARHPSTQIPRETVEEIAYRLYLARLEPPMTPEESRAKTRVDADGKIITSDATRRRNSSTYLPMLRDAIRIMWDMNLIATGEFW